MKEDIVKFDDYFWSILNEWDKFFQKISDLSLEYSGEYVVAIENTLIQDESPKKQVDGFNILILIFLLIWIPIILMVFLSFDQYWALIDKYMWLIFTCFFILPIVSWYMKYKFLHISKNKTENHFLWISDSIYYLGDSYRSYISLQENQNLDYLSKTQALLDFFRWINIYCSDIEKYISEVPQFTRKMNNSLFDLKKEVSSWFQQLLEINIQFISDWIQLTQKEIWLLEKDTLGIHQFHPEISKTLFVSLEEQKKYFQSIQDHIFSRNISIYK